MRRVARVIVWLAAAAAVVVALVNSPGARASDSFWATLQKPGHLVIMRHAEAPGVGDPPGFQIDDCTTQRNLDARGRAQSRRIGEELARRGVRFSAVFSSAWCRCLETARLVAGRDAEVLAPLNSFFGANARGPQQIADLKAAIATLPSEGTPLLVTHQVVVTGLTGLNPASGEMVVLERGADGRLSVAGRLLIR
jgi:phosphohistidine phosphatase SixA